MGHLDGYGHECDACGALIYDRFRTRHSDCAAPRLPDEFYMARERVRNMRLNRERTGYAYRPVEDTTGQ